MSWRGGSRRAGFAAAAVDRLIDQAVSVPIVSERAQIPGFFARPVSASLESARTAPPDAAARSMRLSRIRNLLPVALANRSNVLVLGSVWPLSRRAMADWLVPIRTASSDCDSPDR